MKNLAKNFESLEELPSRSRMKECDNPTRGFYPSRSRNDYPWKRVWRFLMSNVGQHWDNVYSKYCKLDWVPHRYKNLEKISNNVILNTFLKDGKVYYYESCRYNLTDPLTNERCVEDHYRECFYINPKTKLLCFKQAKKQDNNEAKIKEAKTMRILGPYHQLLKINGVWHEVKGEAKNNENIIEIDGLHYQLIDTIKPVKKFYVHGGYWIDDFSIPAGFKNYKIIGQKVYAPYTEHKYSDWSTLQRIGPNDRMIRDYSLDEKHYYWNRKNFESVKVTMRRQLNSKDLRKHGLKNDKEATGPICPKCGGISGKHCFHHRKENIL